ncbi:hypothetical protein GTQ40_12780 [Flavobacteriaceae bacterium R38]|nr:hypothetical protein [Flavobacteriaceae bacterium R38]
MKFKAFIIKIILIFCTPILPQILSAQQFLWTTAKITKLKNIPIENVTNEVLDFYDFYEYYADGTGYSKNNFLKMLERYDKSKDVWEFLRKSLIEIEELTVFALKDNLGQGSIVLIILISSKGIDIIAFTNNFESNVINASPYDKQKFEKWFNSLLK